nr:DUF3052 domain-containing protein [Pseudomonas sp. GM67]
MPNTPAICRSRLAGDGDLADAIASKLAPTGFVWALNPKHPAICRSRLAGDGDLTDAIASKPGSYRLGGVSPGAILL